MSSFAGIREEIGKLPVIDTHEHLRLSSSERPEHRDVLVTYLEKYFPDDLLSAGMTELELAKARDTNMPVRDRFLLIKPYFELCRETGYTRALSTAARGLHGVEHIDENSIEMLQQSFEQSYTVDYYRSVFEKCNIRVALLDNPCEDRFECDRHIFKRVWVADKYVVPGPVAGHFIQWLEGHYTKIETLDDYLSALGQEISEVLGRGISTIKLGITNGRMLCGDGIGFEQAAKLFKLSMHEWRQRGGGARDHFEFPLDLQDFMIRQILSSLQGSSAVVQLETGVRFSAFESMMNSNPMNLDGIFSVYSDVRFDLLYCGWPWWRQTLAMAKRYANVTLDMAWLHVNDPYSAYDCFRESIDTVPLSKILAFGGDYSFADGVYGHLQIALDNIAGALSALVDAKRFPSERAIEIANMVLYENPKKLFGL